MANLVPVDHDPFAPQAQQPKLQPVDHDPFATQADAATAEGLSRLVPISPTAANAGAPGTTGNILPFSIGADGKAQFDSNAGVLGMVKGMFTGAKNAVTLPRDVYEGKVDLNSDEATGRVLEASSLAMPMNPAIRVGDRAIPGVGKSLTRETVVPPSAEALKAASTKGYDTARSLGVEYSSDAVKNVATAIRSNLEQDGVLGELAPKSFKILEKLQNPPDGSTAPLSGLVAARRAFGNAGKDFNNPTDQLAAGRARSGLDEFLEGGDPANVVAGPAAEASRMVKDANGNYAAAKRSDKLNGIEEAADLRAQAANSGQNIDNATRQRIANFILKDRETAGFSEAELGALESAVRGSRTANTARTIGNLFGGGGGLGTFVTGAVGAAPGYASGSTGLMAAGLAPVALGVGAKQVANTLTRKAFERAEKMTRTRSPLYEQMLADAPVTGKKLPQREAVVRALLLAQGIQLPE